MVCRCILGWQSVMYQFCYLDLIFRIIGSGPYYEGLDGGSGINYSLKNLTHYSSH